MTGPVGSERSDGVDRRFMITGLAALTAGCTQAATSRGQLTGNQIPAGAFTTWTDQASEYVLFPGDEIDISLPSAQELNRPLIIGPDGRVSLAIIGHIMAADRTVPQLEAFISDAYSEHLLRPAVEVSLRKAAPAKVWIDGQVTTPGVYDIPSGQIDALQALSLAAGVRPSGKPSQTALIRRAPDGTRMMKIVDLRPAYGPAPIIQRGDILFVPRSGLGELTNFFSQVRDAMPLGFSYSLNGGRY